MFFGTCFWALTYNVKSKLPSEAFWALLLGLVFFLPFLVSTLTMLHSQHMLNYRFVELFTLPQTSPMLFHDVSLCSKCSPITLHLASLYLRQLSRQPLWDSCSSSSRLKQKSCFLSHTLTLNYYTSLFTFYSLILKRKSLKVETTFLSFVSSFTSIVLEV